MHPRYQLVGVFNDIALIDLVEPVQFSDTIQPARLPKRELYRDVTATISGFGFRNTTDITEHLRNWIERVSGIN